MYFLNLFIKHVPLLWSNTTCCNLHLSFICGDAVTSIMTPVIAFPLQF